jgi:hypothetical protein
MALHRDIYWLGRQWAVTGLGLQLIDQKLQGFFDIEASRLWEEPLIAKMHAKEWLNRADFDKGLALARTRYSQTPRATEPLPPAEEPVSQLIDSILATPPRPAPKLDVPKPKRLDPVAPRPEPAAVIRPEPIEPAPIELEPVEPLEPTAPGFRFGLAGSARFLRPWRIKLKR